MISRFLRLCLLSLVALLMSCASVPSHPVPRDRDLSTLLPLQEFVARFNQSGSHALSPDGSQLRWVGLSGPNMVTFVRRVDGSDTRAYRFGRNYPSWAWDSRHLIYEDDATGGENTQILLLDTAQPDAQPINLTPWAGSKSHVIHHGDARSNRIVFVSNRRDPAVFDAYSADIATGKVELLLQNTSDVHSLVMDIDDTIGARIRQQDEYQILQMLNKPHGTWRSVYKWRRIDTVWPLRTDRQHGRVWMVSNIGRDKNALVELSLVDGKERVLSSHPR